MASCLGLSRETRKSAKLPSLTSQFLTFSSWSWALSEDQSWGQSCSQLWGCPSSLELNSDGFPFFGSSTSTVAT